MTTNSTTLTDKQRQILQLFSQGLKGREVAEALGLSTHTIKNHLTTIHKKLRASNTTQAIVTALKLGLLERKGGKMEGRLRPKYSVYRLNVNRQDVIGTRMLSTDPDSIDSPFVLMPRKDPAAFLAMVCYARFCEPDLRAEIATWLNKIADSAPVFGTQGARNYMEMKAKEIELGL